MTERIGRKWIELLRDELPGRHAAIVRQAADLKLMSGAHIERIHFTRDDHATTEAAARAARRVLAQLVRDRLLIRLERRIGGVRAGSASYIYAIGPIGQRVLGHDGEPRRRFREPSLGFVRHTLAITELVVELTGAGRGGGCELLGLQPEPHCWRTFAGPIGAPVALRPDLFVLLGVGDFEHRWFCEVDLGTEHLPTLLRKCRMYEAYRQTGVEQAAHDVFPRVLWLMNSDRRAERLRDAIDRSSRLTSELFTVARPADALKALMGVA